VDPAGNRIDGKGAPTVVDGSRFVGLDVHARESACAVVDLASGEVIQRRVRGRPRRVLEFLECEVARPWRAVYEAGPTGYGLARAAAERGLDVAVCAPAHIPRQPGDRVKTDTRDALKLARLLAAGQLKLVRIPDPRDEWLRDLVRCREDARIDLMRARHRLSKFCLRRDLYFPGPGRAWTARHRDWLAGLRFDDRASELAFVDYLHAHDALLARRDRLDAALAELAGSCQQAPLIARLRCLRGIDTLSATGLACEVPFAAFAKPQKVSAFVGLVPSETSSGARRRQGTITRAGSKHARRLLVEAAWHYRRPPRVAKDVRARQAGQDPAAIETAWRAQQRLHARWQHLEGERGKRSTTVAVAVARELAAFCWELAHQT
jgi:transposase